MQIAFLTPTQNHASGYDLPVVKVQNVRAEIKFPDGLRSPSRVLTTLTTDQLRAKGVARFDEETWNGSTHRSTGYLDAWNSNGIYRDHTLEALPPPPKPSVIDYETFTNRFTNAEFNAATEFVEEVNLTNGKPKRLALKQGMARVYAKGVVDLNDPRTDQFLTALVAGGVITAERKTEIITP